MAILHIDFETFSKCDLKAEGLARYAADPSTGVHCMAFAFDDENVVGLWRPFPTHIGGIITPAVTLHVKNGGLVYAHNAAFELAIWSNVMAPRYGWPPLKPEQCRCTMAMAYAMALPGALENAAPAVGIPQRKDAEGKRIMLQVCRPKADGTFWKYEDDPAKFEKLYAYCKQDVAVERALHSRLQELSPTEQKLWELDYKINQRGILVDLPNIDRALKLVESEKIRLDREMLKATGGVVGACSEVQLLVKWIRSQGVELKGVAKSDLLDALSDADLPPKVRAVMKLRQEAAKTSTAKFLAMKNRALPNGRVCGIHQFHGASTGRWAGRGVQTQNLARPRASSKPKDIQAMIDMFEKPQELNMFYGPVLDALSDCLRGMIVAPEGMDLVAGDFSSVEAGVLAWLAGEERVLDIFRTHGKIYEHAAAGIYHVAMDEVTKSQRQIGKVAVLALGYGGGVGAFQSMAKNYGIKVKDAEAEEIKKAWRVAHPNIVQYWHDVEDAAIRALTTGETTQAGDAPRHVNFKKAGSFLWCKLPSGRVLCYPYPELRIVTTPWGAEKEALTYMTVVDPARKLKILEDANASGSWKRISTYGGSLAENVTQAVARDLLRDAMFRLDDAGYPINMHVHDEAVVEIPETAAPNELKKVEAIMAEVPTWAAGLPMAVEGWRARRYQK